MAIYYVDFENVYIGGLKGAESLYADDTVLVYCRDKDVSAIETECKKRKIENQFLEGDMLRETSLKSGKGFQTEIDRIVQGVFL